MLLFSQSNIIKADSSSSPDFIIPNFLSAYTVTACSIDSQFPLKIEGNTRIIARDFSSSNELFGASIRSNASIKVSGNAYLNGDAFVAPGNEVIVNGNAEISGSIITANDILNCSIDTISELLAWVKQNHHNELIPITNQGRLPWGCAGNPAEWEFCLNANESITISEGIYWFTKWTQSGNSHVTFNGYVRIFVTGEININGNATVNSEANPYNLLIYQVPENPSTLFEFTLSGNSIFNALLYAPNSSVHLSGQSVFNGSLAVREFKSSGQAKIFEWIDNSLPEITFVSPPDACLNSSDIEVHITASNWLSGIDPSSIVLYRDDIPVEFTANALDPEWHSVAISSTLTGFDEGSHRLNVELASRSGNIAKGKQNFIIDLTAPTVAIVYPAPQTQVVEDQIQVMGNAFDEFQQACGLTIKVNNNIVAFEYDGAWLTTVGRQGGPLVIKAEAQDGAGNVTIHEITVQPFAQPPEAPVAIEPVGLYVDVHSVPGTSSNLNGILEPGETVLVEPRWMNKTDVAVSLTGTGVFWTGPSDATYTIIDNSSYYGTIQPQEVGDCLSASPSSQCYLLKLGTRLLPHRDTWFTEDLNIGGAKVWTIHIGRSFNDVPPENLFYYFVETLLHHGITSGCAGINFCPDKSVTRGELAIFLARILADGDGNVPAKGTIEGIGDYDCSSGTEPGVSLFADIPANSMYCRYAHYIVSAQLMTKCSATPLKFCPDAGVSRGEAAESLANTLTLWDIPESMNDPITGNVLYSCNSQNPQLHFNDTQASSSLCRSAHYLWANGIVSGCSSNQYCPTLGMTRAQVAKLLINSFEMNLYKSLGEGLECKSGGKVTWGGYSLLSQPHLPLSQIDTITGKMKRSGYQCFRTFLNSYFYEQGYQKAPVFPYKLVDEANKKYDLNQWDDVFWKRVNELTYSHKCGKNYSKDKAVFSIGHVYQCKSVPGLGVLIGPWCGDHNINDIDVRQNWMNDWPANRTWIENEYVRLTEELIKNGVDVVEIYNEAHPTSAALTAHHNLIDKLRADIDTKNITIQANIMNYDLPIWDDLQDEVQYWAEHGLYPSQVESVAEQVLTSNKYELSTDGQQCIMNDANNTGPYVHYLSGELFKEAKARKKHFENTVFHGKVMTSWHKHELDEVKALCKNSNQVFADIFANCSDGPITVAQGANVKIHWSSLNANSCIVKANGDPVPGWNTLQSLPEGHGRNKTVSITTKFSIECIGAGGTARDEVVVKVNVPQQPWAQIKANNSPSPTYVPVGSDVPIWWNSGNTTDCKIKRNGSNIGPGWTGTSGEKEFPNLAESSVFGVYCSHDNFQNALAEVQVFVYSCLEIPTLISDVDAVTMGGLIELTAYGKDLDQAAITWSQNPETPAGTFFNKWVKNDGTEAHASWATPGTGIYKCKYFDIKISLSLAGCPSVEVIKEIKVGFECVTNDDCDAGAYCSNCWCYYQP
ncbi:MAG: S-layer homology domain-containing protein [Bacteroidales bacterium]